jgi:hypothetical protein
MFSIKFGTVIILWLSAGHLSARSYALRTFSLGWRRELAHTTKSASYRQNTNLLSNLWSLICLPAERRMPLRI